MNTYELNKIFGAVLFAGLTAMTAWLISLAAFGKLEHSHHERVIHYVVAGLEQDDAMHDEAVADEPEMPAMSLAELLADADAAKGQKVFKKCAACHTVDDGGKNKVGPNLWNIVNRPIGTHEGFTYSGAMAGVGRGLGLGAPQRLHRRPQGQRAGHQDGLQGGLQGRRPGQRARLSPFPQRRAGGAADRIGRTPRPLTHAV